MVLLVDSDANVRALITALLHREGMTLDTAGDGNVAIDKLRTSSYCAVLLEPLLRGTEGLEVLRFLRAEQPAMLPRVVLVTTASDQALRRLTERDLVWDVVRKPFDIHHLINVVRACGAQRN